MSGNPAGMVTHGFKSYYRTAGFTPAEGIILSSSPETARLNETLFLVLDRNGDKQLSKEELAKAVGLLKRFDADENDLLTPNEILNGGINTGEKQSKIRPIQFLPLDATRGIDLRIEMRLSIKKKSPQWKVGGKSLARIPEEGVRFDIPGATGSLLPSTTDVGPQLQATREFYLSTFRAGLGNKPALPAKDTEDEPALQIIDAIFPFADRNADGKLTVGELEGFLTLIENGIRAQRTIVVNDTGSNLFTLLDENHDGKLDRRELLRTPRLLSHSDIPLKRTDLKRQISITVHEERIGTSFGPVRFAAAKKQRTVEDAPKAAGSAWFKAMDRNGDGFLSPREFLGSPELFKQFDTDHDGLIGALTKQNRLRNALRPNEDD